ncbi:hypothetical protein RNAN_0225 [Rheinheimera nanhaiensis E407-8]|uniref:Uncharacterized protein n=1 Tax=Rheinheimera nanhaiensis E407-8 TaxID=562729 RepID=I1DT84_9GAMM|nr:hypothetical protein RNAN_0225 [Rheinheimera nanhaiensis E407-8]
MVLALLLELVQLQYSALAAQMLVVCAAMAEKSPALPGSDKRR